MRENRKTLEDADPRREYYIKFFDRMEDLYKKQQLDAKKFGDVDWAIIESVYEHKLFTEKELREMYPVLLGQ